jgi:putative oxidoreductase
MNAQLFNAHLHRGVVAVIRGWELVGVIAAVALVLAAVGAGRYSVDHALATRRTPAPV